MNDAATARPRWWWVLAAGMALIGALPWMMAAVGFDGGFLFVGYCHQQVERTLHVDGHAMAVCSRCAGIYGGVALGVMLALPRRTYARWMKLGRWLVVAAIVANAADWTWSAFQPEALSHGRRILVGALFGATATAFMLVALARDLAPMSAPLGEREG